MTSPDPAGEFDDATPPEQTPLEQAGEAAVVAAIAAALASLVRQPLPGVAEARAVMLASDTARRIIDLLTGLGVSTVAAWGVLASTIDHNPIPDTSRVAPDSARARRAMQTTNLLRRAQYIVRAARRVAKDYARRLLKVDDPSDLKARRDALREALRRERIYLKAHLDAQKARNAAARQVDDMAAKHGDQLTWHSTVDSRTSKYCLKANGKQFFASQMPPLGFPGTVHPTCRCKAAPPDKTGRAGSVYDVPPLDD